MKESDEGVVPMIRRRQPPNAGEGRPEAEGNPLLQTANGILCPGKALIGSNGCDEREFTRHHPMWEPYAVIPSFFDQEALAKVDVAKAPPGMDVVGMLRETHREWYQVTEPWPRDSPLPRGWWRPQVPPSLWRLHQRIGEARSSSRQPLVIRVDANLGRPSYAQKLLADCPSAAHFGRVK
jgi:hypothetical protein